MTKNNNLTEGKIFPSLIKFTLPIFFTILLQITYGLVDVLIVGKYGTVGDVSGVSIGSQVIKTVTSVFTGLSMGTTILLGRFIGAKEPEKTTKTVGVSIWIFSIIAIITCIALTLSSSLIANIMQTPKEAMVQATNYLIISGIGIVFIVFYNLLGSIFRGIGDSKTPLVAVSIACAINVILDLILIAGFKMGATGAAFATVIAQASSVFISIFILSKKELPFKITKKDVKYDKVLGKNIIGLGIPVALQGTLVSISFLFITSLVNTFGVHESAAVGIVEKISSLILIVPISFMQCLSAFTAQNHGAEKYKRAKQGMFIAMGISLAFGVIMAYLSAFHGIIFTRIFIDDAETTRNALLYLRSYSLDTIFVSILFAFAGYFNGCGQTTFSMFQAVFGAFLIRIPFAYIFSSLENTNLFVIGLATPLSTLIQIILCIVFYIWYQNKNKERLLLDKS